MNKPTIFFSSGSSDFLKEGISGRRFFPVIAGQLKHTRLGGLEVRTSLHCPEFVQTIRMRECGCSSHALTAMNDYLLQAFGRRREALILGDNMVIMHPNTLDYLNYRAFLESARGQAYIPAFTKAGGAGA